MKGAKNTVVLTMGTPKKGNPNFGIPGMLKDAFDRLRSDAACVKDDPCSLQAGYVLQVQGFSVEGFRGSGAEVFEVPDFHSKQSPLQCNTPGALHST